MTRGDARLMIAILGTAIVTAVTTVVVNRWLVNDAGPPKVRLEPTEAVVPLPPPPSLPDPPPPAEADVPPDPDPCDEVACVLANYEPVCCHAMDKRRTRDAIDRDMIVAAVARVRTQVIACGERSTAKGEVKIAVKVAPSGKVSSTAVKTTPDDKLGRCVAAAMSRMRFPTTRDGGSFSYPFRF